jgi:hypothetical protein
LVSIGGVPGMVLHEDAKTSAIRSSDVVPRLFTLKSFRDQMTFIMEANKEHA